MIKWISILVLIALIMGLGIILFQKDMSKQSGISTEEKRLIEVWIKENNLNDYGDPQDTVYTGGTPLFDEATGKQTDRYEYILRNYPGRPWRK